MYIPSKSKRATALGYDPNKRRRKNTSYSAAPSRSTLAGLAKRVVSTAAQFHPYGRAAVNAASMAGAAYSAYKNAGTQTTRGRVRAQHGGRYVGRFKKPRKVRKNMYLAKGFQHTIEVNGQVSDPDCVYVGHSTFSPVLIIEVIAQALLRKLLTKAGWNCTSITQNIPGYLANTSDCWLFRITRINKDTGVSTSFDYSTPAATDVNIQQICGNSSTGTAPLWPDFLNILKEFAGGSGGTSTSNMNVPYKLMLYRQEANVGIFHQFQCELNLANEKVHLMSSSNLKVQNRTVSADGSGSIDSVSNNPIQGYLYHFKNGAPYTRIEDAFLLEKMISVTGAITVRAAEMTGSATGLTEPPSGKIFSNCSGQSRIRLDPGNIKHDRINHKVNGKPLLQFLTAFGYGQGTTGNFKKLFGKSALIAFEDVINVNVSYNITIAYEVNRLYGCYLTTSKASPALGARYQMTQNSVPA